jgi:hypothetical protein
MLEAITFLGLLHRWWGILFPFHICPCFLMSALLGSFVMGLALAANRKPKTLVGIGAVAALFCFLAVPFLPEPSRTSTYGPVVSSATAAFVGAVCFALVTGILMNKLDVNAPRRIGVGALAGILASALFIVATAYLLDKPIWADLGYARPLPDFLYIGGMAWMGLAATFFPLGYSVGAKVHSWLTSGVLAKPLALVGGALVCCGTGAVAFAVGLG